MHFIVSDVGSGRISDEKSVRRNITMSMMMRKSLIMFIAANCSWLNSGSKLMICSWLNSGKTPKDLFLAERWEES